jgi:hypothetical protein
VKLKRPVGDKLSITAFGTVTAAGDKLPLWILAKGRTQRCLKKFGQHENVICRQTVAGWTTEPMMLEYLEWLSAEANGEKICLVLDVYPAHRTPKVKSRAAELGIELLYVPAGATGRLQPLDRRIFGELKSRARCEFCRTKRIDGPEMPAVSFYDHAVRILQRCWESIASENIRAAWDVQ